MTLTLGDALLSAGIAPSDRRRSAMPSSASTRTECRGSTPTRPTSELDDGHVHTARVVIRR